MRGRRSRDRLAQAENRHAELLSRRERRRQELERQRSLTLQAVERITSVLILPHPEREAPDVRNLRPNLETEAIAMKVVIEHEEAQSRQVYDVHEKNLGYDITSFDLSLGELRLIEVKGIGEAGASAIANRLEEQREVSPQLTLFPEMQEATAPKSKACLSADKADIRRPMRAFRMRHYRATEEQPPWTASTRPCSSAGLRPGQRLAGPDQSRTTRPRLLTTCKRPICAVSYRQ